MVKTTAQCEKHTYTMRSEYALTCMNLNFGYIYYFHKCHDKANIHNRCREIIGRAIYSTIRVVS